MFDYPLEAYLIGAGIALMFTIAIWRMKIRVAQMIRRERRECAAIAAEYQKTCETSPQHILNASIQAAGRTARLIRQRIECRSVV